MTENNGGHFVDIDKWVVSLARELEDVPHYMCNPGHPGRISKIPQNLREVDSKAYEPYFLSIGPYYNGNPRVQRIEKRKRLVLKSVLEQNPSLTLVDYLKEMRRIEPLVRSFYSDVDMESENFLHMLLLDSFYIITVCCGLPNSETHTSIDSEKIHEETGACDDNESLKTGITDESSDDTSSQKNNGDWPRWFWTLFTHDIFLLENQLPFFVLEKLHSLAYGCSAIPLIDIMKDRIGSILSDYTTLGSEMTISPTKEVGHLLHLCHMFFRPILQHESIAPELSESSQIFRLGSAVQLYEAGVSFEATSISSQHSLLDIKFGSSGKITFPCLSVDDNTDSLLRNLIALEQMKYPTLGLNVSAYAVLLLHLITIPEDAALLRRKGIIRHHLASDKEMMYLVNRLSVGLSFDYVEDNYSLKPVFQELKKYSEHRVPRWRAWLKHRYFNNPWTTISLLAASVLLFLSALQTYYTVYSYYYPCCDWHS